jgi:hypothetical protein
MWRQEYHHQHFPLDSHLRVELPPLSCKPIESCTSASAANKQAPDRTLWYLAAYRFTDAEGGNS